MAKTENAPTNTYDVLIVGAGISGFYAALHMPKGARVAIADKYKFLGGRTFTFQKDISGVNYQWEEGAARIANSHTMLINLVKKYRLTLIPIGGETVYRESGAYPVELDHFQPSLPITLEPLRRLPPYRLANTTIRKLLTDLHGERLTNAILNRYPYRAEMDVMRADMALDLFAHEFKSFAGYSIIKEGFSELIARMRKDFEGRGGTILAQHELVGLEGERQAIFRKGRPSDGVGRPEVKITADRIILALPSLSLGHLPQFSEWPILRHLQMKPLLRVYAVFPKTTEKKGVWFEGLPKIITPASCRFIIPNSATNGTIQISYTDSLDAEPLQIILEKDGETALGKFLVAELRKLLQDRNSEIPDPLFVKAHSWKDGVTYWLPGDYNPYELSTAACVPFPKKHPNWFVCGESYSTRQCWVEGALEHTAEMLKVFNKSS